LMEFCWSIEHLADAGEVARASVPAQLGGKVR
jgi:hypothetical protein